MRPDDVILGAGMTGIAVAWSSGLAIYEAEARPGGICRSYHLRPGLKTPLADPSEDGESYRFEIGGGHWIFGGDPLVLRFMNRFASMKRYQRRAVVHFPDSGLTVPYPLQYHLHHLGRDAAERALGEMRKAPDTPPRLLSAWLEQSFGPTLTSLFFGPFHEAYTAGLWTEIAPQDGLKSPVNLAMAAQGATGGVQTAGYNSSFLYPEQGLAGFAESMASSSLIHYQKMVTSIDLSTRVLQFQDGASVRFNTLISTLPLHRMLDLCRLTVDEPPDPHTSVLVLNIGAIRGACCPDSHWVYVPRSRSRFHRIGFYSNVETSFLPSRSEGRVSIYVERAFRAGSRPSLEEIAAYSNAVIEELQDWGFIGPVEVLDPSWVEVAYTWRRPESRWREKALQVLSSFDVVMVGRYGAWQFQGIADSIRDGLMAGACLRRDAAGSLSNGG